MTQGGVVKNTRVGVVRLTVGLLTCAAVLSSAAAATPAPQPSSSTATTPSLAELPFVFRSGNTLIVDVSVDKEARLEQFMRADAAGITEGMLVQFVDGTVDSRSRAQASEDARKADAALIDSSLNQVCPSEPRSPRSEDGSTRPYLGCDPVTGIETFGESKQGLPAESLEAALEEVLSSGLGIPDGVESVIVDGRSATVNLTSAVDAGLRTSDQLFAVTESLWFTAHSNGSLDSVMFTVEGDCMAYSRILRGDMCGAYPLDNP